MQIAGLAIEAATVPALAAGLGLYLDGRYGWSPWGTVVGLVIGGGLAGRIVMEIVRKTEEKKDESDGG